MENEIWKPVVRKGKTIPGYYISNYGRISSSKTGKILSIRNRTSSERGDASDIMLPIPKRLSKYFFGRNRIYCQIHQLVAEAFMPIDQYVPECLKPHWDNLHEDVKRWVRDTVYIDHIDNNPFNNRVDNLRYVKPVENNSHNKKLLNEKNNTRKCGGSKLEFVSLNNESSSGSISLWYDTEGNEDDISRIHEISST